MDKEKLIALVIVGAYCLLVTLTHQWDLLWKLLIILIFPLACIWYSEEIGNYTGTLTNPSVTQKTPAIFVKIGGWVLLLLPAMAAVYMQATK